MFNFFKSKSQKEIVSIDWSEIGLDFHSHLIPSVDDGSQTIEESYEILRFLQNIGYQKVITSPHIMEEGFENTKEDLESKFLELKSDERIRTLNLELGIIAEYYLDEGFGKLLANDEIMTFGDKYVLIETSMNYEFPFVKEYIFELFKKGYNPILAHPERYGYITNEKNYIDIYDDYKSMGLLFQLNLFSLAGLYGEKVKKTAETLIDLGMYDLVSSDIHKAGQISLFEKLNSSLHLQRLIESGNIRNKQILSS